MYAEERQQAMAQLIGQQGRLSVAQLAGTFDVTTETVRRDLSSLERIGLVRRVHGGAVPSSSLSVIESALGERDQANIAAKDAIAAAALDQLPRRRRSSSSTPARPRPGSPRCSPASTGSRSSPTRSRSPRGSPGSPTSSCTCCPAGSARPRTRPSATDTVAALGELRADVAFVGDQRAQRRLRADHPRPRRGRHQARHRGLRPAYVVLADSSKIGVETPVRFAALERGRRAGHRLRHHRPSDRTALEQAGLEVVVA